MNLDPFNQHSCDEIEELLIKAKLPELLTTNHNCDDQNNAAIVPIM